MVASRLLTIASETALAAGLSAARLRADGVEIAASKSSAEDIVTRADRDTELLIRNLIADARPDDGFVGEEGGAEPGTSGLTWVVDPIDGTVNYLYDRRHWAVSIAVVEGDPEPRTWTALAGAVMNPSLSELFTASQGGGAYLGGRRLNVNEAELSLALVGTGFSYAAATRREQALVIAELITRVRDIRRAGVAALDLCDVAAGRVDAYYERGLKPWDHAAGSLIASEAGARVAALDGSSASDDFLLAAAPDLWNQLQEILVAAVIVRP